VVGLSTIKEYGRYSAKKIRLGEIFRRRTAEKKGVSCAEGLGARRRRQRGWKLPGEEPLSRNENQSLSEEIGSTPWMKKRNIYILACGVCVSG